MYYANYSLTVNNSPPSKADLTLTSSSGSYFENADLYCNVDARDTGSTNITAYYQWYNDSEVINNGTRF